MVKNRGKKKLMAGLMAAALVAASIPGIFASADATKVVSLGQDLTAEQQRLMMQYFNVSESDGAQIIYVNNQQERDHLASYIPLEQIGNRTVSCAYINPTESGGIHVKTANLQYVTANMIAQTLADLGISNCEVVAACPFQVSGTGALTGIIMAYETATGETLEETKVEIATQEVVVMKDLAQDIGTAQAETIVSQSKTEALQNNLIEEEVLTDAQIRQIVLDVIEENTDTSAGDDVYIDESHVENITNLITNIINEDYGDTYIQNIEQINNNITQQAQQGNPGTQEQPDVNLDVDITIDNTNQGNDVDVNNTNTNENGGDNIDVSGGDANASAGNEAGDTFVANEDSITLNVNDDVLGGDVIVSSTDEEVPPVPVLETDAPENQAPETNAFGWEESTESFGGDGQPVETEAPAVEEPTPATEVPETEEPVPEAPVIEEPVTEASTVEEPATEIPVEVVTEAPAEETEYVEPETTTAEEPGDLTLETEETDEETEEEAIPDVSRFGYGLKAMAEKDEELARAFMEFEGFLGESYPYDETYEADFNVEQNEDGEDMSFISKTLLDAFYGYVVPDEDAEAEGDSDEVETEAAEEEAKTLAETLADAIQGLLDGGYILDEEADAIREKMDELEITDDNGGEGNAEDGAEEADYFSTPDAPQLEEEPVADIRDGWETQEETIILE